MDDEKPLDDVKVPVLPRCDIHWYERNQTEVPAAVDGKTKAGPWANMCSSCHLTHGVGLGLGKGQRLILIQPAD